MKRTLFILSLVFLAGTVAWSQESLVTLSGGYAWSNMEEAESNATGYRINGLYEFNPNEGMVAHGISFGYIHTSAESSVTDGVEYKLNNWPIYYAPKVMFGKGKLNAFLKGALGLHFSGYKRVGGATELDTNDTGFYGGAGAGAMFQIKGNIHINVEYEWAYLSNSWYQDGFLNSAMAGLVLRF